MTPTAMTPASKMRVVTNAEREALVLSLEDREQRDRRSDAGQSDDDLQKAAQQDGGRGAGADDEVRVGLHLVVQGK